MAAPEEIVLLLPWPPTANHLHTVFRGRKILSRRGKAYRAAVAAAVLECGRPRAPDGERLCVLLDLYQPDRRKRDLANAEKAILDSCVGAGVMADDSLIDRLVLTRRGVIKGGAVVMTVRLMSDVDAGPDPLAHLLERRQEKEQ